MQRIISALAVAAMATGIFVATAAPASAAPHRVAATQTATPMHVATAPQARDYGKPPMGHPMGGHPSVVCVITNDSHSLLGALIGVDLSNVLANAFGQQCIFNMGGTVTGGLGVDTVNILGG